MGQILNRIIDIAKSYKGSQRADEFYFENEDDELKRIIDELNANNRNSYYDKKQTADSKRQTEEKMTPEEAFAILKISKNASNDEIKAAYKERMKEYHPDRLENLGNELQELAKRKTQEINEAFTLIKKERSL